MSKTCSTQAATQALPRAAVRAWVGALAAPVAGDTGAEQVELLSALEQLKSAAAALQARVTVAFDAGQRAEQAAAGVPARKQGRSVAAQVALARHDSPARGARHLGLAKALVREMPRTLEALATGRISEWRATILVRETAHLSAAHRDEVDRRMIDRLGSLGDRGTEREARALGYRLDPASALRRTRGAHADRRVTVRPAPDTMTYLTGFLPVAQGVAVHAALARQADSLRAGGDARTRGQIMADTLVQRVTGQASADAVSVEVTVVMTDRSLLHGDDEPAHVVGHGPVPAALARDLVRDAGWAWVRRLFLDPAGRGLVAMDTRRRDFDGQLRRFLVLRDQVCRTPWCDAPVRHADHVRAHADGGPTSAANGQGLCERCNHAKQAGGRSSTVTRAGPGHRVELRTPTGHLYVSQAPRAPGTEHDTEHDSVLEHRLRALIAA